VNERWHAEEGWKIIILVPLSQSDTKIKSVASDHWKCTTWKTDLCLNSDFEAVFKSLMSVVFVWGSIRFAQYYLSANSLYGSCCCHASLGFCLFWVLSCCSWLFSRPTWKLRPHSEINLLNQHEDGQGTSPTPISCSPAGCFLRRPLGIRQFQTAQSCYVLSLESVACLGLLNPYIVPTS